jgi:aminoglycoside phosphotransferase (APT) family kinase protein
MREVDVELVTRLVAAQFPQWAALPIVELIPQGWDNRTFRLGSRMTVRLPSAEEYARQVEKEQSWLPRLAPQLPIPIPSPVAQGAPAHGFPWSWSIYRWIDGETSSGARIRDLPTFAADLAAFLLALRHADATDGPAAGPQSFYRGAPLHVYDADVNEAIRHLGAAIDQQAVTEVWTTALSTEWMAAPVWFHGDVSAGNLLVRNGTLAAVIDFGLCGIGDPACDLVIAYTLLEGPSRETFRAGVGLDDATWARARGWALWKALIVAAGITGTHSPARHAEIARRVIDAVIADHQSR